MIDRPNGFRHEEIWMTEIDLYPTPAVYLDHPDDFDPDGEPEMAVWDWADRLVQKAKAYFPFCNFDVSTYFHDGDNRLYAIVKIVSPNGSHTEVAEWLAEHTKV